MSTKSREFEETFTDRPSTPERTQSLNGSSHIDVTPVAKSNPFDALRFRLRQDAASSVGHFEQSIAPRRPYGIPTPPYSETTSSASGSVGRSRKDSNDASNPSRHTPDLESRRSERLQPPSTSHNTSASSRSPSAASSSSNTGSDTVGGRSPTQPSHSHFASSRHSQVSGTKMISESAAILSANSSASLHSLIPGRRDRATGDSAVPPTTTSSSAPRASSSLSSHPNSPDERRKRRSEMHERDVSQIRSESRLGYGDDDDDRAAGNNQSLEQQHVFPRAPQHKYSPRKSTTLSVTSSRYDDNESPNGEQQSPSRRASLHGLDTKSPSTPNSNKPSRYTGGHELPSGSMRRLVRTTGRASGRHSLDDRTSPSSTSASRSPMPAEFRLPDKEIRRAYRAANQRKSDDPDDSDMSDDRAELLPASTASTIGNSATVCSHVPTQRDVPSQRDSLDEIQEEGAKDKPMQPRIHQSRRRRYVSDAAADESVEQLGYDGRLGTQGSRISVDSSSAQRHLARGPMQSTPTSSCRTSRSFEIGSPSEEARIRKISSTSSSRSQKSSSCASELHRTASRVSMRKQYGSDLFSADPLSSLTTAGRRPRSPPSRTGQSSSSTHSSDLSRPYDDQHRRVSDAAFDSLRNQIEDLHVGRSGGEKHRRHLSPVSSRARVQLGPTRSSLELKSPALGSMRAQSVLGLERTPKDAHRIQQMHQYPLTDPQGTRYDRSWPAPDLANSSDAANRIYELVSLRADANYRQPAPRRSATVMGTASESPIVSPILDPRERIASNGDEPAPIRNLAIRLSQYEALYSKGPSAEPGTSTAAGQHTARTVELMGAIVRGISTMWIELSSMHPIATEGHLMGRKGEAFTEAFDRLDDGLAFVNKLVLEQARAIQDLLFLLDRTEKERQAQLNQALVEMGHSPRPFSRMGAGSTGPTPGGSKFAHSVAASDGAERNTHLLRRATSTVRGGSNLQTESPSQFVRSSRRTGSVERGATLTASQIRSMTSLGHASTHARSASELSPSSSAAQRRLDRVALQLPRESSQDSPLSSRRSVIGRPFPTADNTQTTATSSNNSSTTSRPAPGFAPRRPRLSNPSVSNATASFQPSTVSAASSAVASSPENSLHNGFGGREMDSERSTVGGEHASVAGEADEFGRPAGGSAESATGGETVRLSSRSQRRREAATIRGGPRVIDTLASQLDDLGGTNEQGEMQSIGGRDGVHIERMRHGVISGHSAQRRHTINSHITPSPAANVVVADEEDRNRSPPKLSQYGLTKSSNPPPRPPRHVQRPSEESIPSAGRKILQGRRDEPSTPTTVMSREDFGTPRATDHRSGWIHDEDIRRGDGQTSLEVVGASSSVVRSLGRTAARRVSRVLGSGQ
ncbi:uncharacterized protein MEPE_01259 [Melanopsichium pennsylvanicum]|uniref:Uncharacterized protein n=2 Tax=Melanopsichium pennsylvanicum TaxID=63383 RepID=A0AAJ4XK35_9BASI|nr:hypothetical protein BN887_05786 [Melanopsichium pennsylvanicum 4]SNX82553.1 uncharacterized protein MEPE_01259 [Melanopsichium pennsylvanicum]